MIRSRRARAVALLAAIALVVAACSDDDKTTTGGGASGSGSAAASDGGTAGGEYKVDTSDCDDTVNEEITGTVKIGSAMPLSGGPATVFAPVAAGLTNYIKDANAKNAVPGVTLELTIEDDQYDPSKTPAAVEKLLDQTGVNFLTGMIGTPNALSVRDTLNRDCIPQLLVNSGDPRWGQAEEFPWSTGVLTSYNTETAIYVEDIKTKLPSGGTVAIFHANNDFGVDYRDTLNELAPDANLEVVDTQTQETADSSPPTSQVTSIAAKRPDVILNIGLGLQCPGFLKELANAKATNAGWNPIVYITATCASTFLLAAAAEAAEGVITVVTGIDVQDPKNAADPVVVDFKKVMTDNGFAADGDFATAAAGWTVGELTVEVLKLAAASPDGLTRASILNAARNLSYEPSLVREGITYKTSGTTDPYLNEVQQVVQYSASTKTYTEQGDLITDFEGKTEVPELSPLHSGWLAGR